jgi:radical SAM superfamily enzyme YgiQ (UPF0313 family)
VFSVLLISLHDTGTYGHRCISSSLKRHGFLVSNVFFRSNSVYQDAAAISEVELQALCNLGKHLRPDLIGINIHSSFGHPVAKQVVLNLKSQIRAPIVLGGIHPTVLPQFCLQDTAADYVCVGEGEESVVELCQCVRDDANVEVAGIMSQAAPHLPGRNRNPPADLDDLPFQDIGDEGKFCVLTDGMIVEGDPLLRQSVYPTKASRGCPFSCSYCTVAELRTLYGPSGFYRLRSPKRVVDEIRQFLELQKECREVQFWDDTFPFKPAWVEEFAAQYIKKIGLPFRIWLNPDTTTEKNIAMLKAAGLQSAVVGIESASDRTRRQVFQRTESRDDILQADRILSKYRVCRMYDFILDHPWENEEELKETFDLVTELKMPFLLNMHSLILLPGTKLARRAIREGLSSEGEIINEIVCDTRSSSRRIQWVRGAPTQEKPERRYWLFMISAAANETLPRVFLRALAGSSVLRKHPEILACGEGIGEWRVETGVPRVLSNIYRRSKWLQRFFLRNPVLKMRTREVLLSLQQRYQALEWLAYVTYRVVTRTPLVVLHRQQRRVID